MAHSFSNANLFSAFVIDGISNVISRICGGITRDCVERHKRRSAAAAEKEEMAGGAKEKVSWVPDPVSRCYRPENSAKEIDVAELRAMLLNKK